ncbi:auxilin-related protein 2-like isoform X4 [Arachis ipaensis]|uniref:auxilin-related protein 2-like isoform X4 n=1 Tax=Arachis ipaensis TaxID=130454 RepID=UPI000A2B5304|nr:auxilin-related protein 2-like isoform X4 [Arachis ipaensis]QHO12171.1 Auxilin-related protein [Arachis hypogaea]
MLEDYTNSRQGKEQECRKLWAKSLAERNQRDLQTQGEQAERHRLAETLDFEIKRWAAGNEGNLRALLSTLHYAKALAEKNQRDLQTQRAS